MSGTKRMIRVGGGRSRGAVYVLVAALLFTGNLAVHATGRGTRASMGVTGALIDGDPFAGVYASLMLPTEGVWGFGIKGNGEYGLETAQDPSREEWFFAGSIAVERSLSDQVRLPPGLTAAVGARAGVMVERETTATLTRTEPYPLAGIYGVMSWSVFHGLGLESSIHLDAGVGVRVAAAFGIHVSLPRGSGT